MHKQELEKGLRPFPRPKSAELLDAVFRSLCESIDSPRSLAAYLMFKHKEYDQLTSLEIDPNLYEKSHAFADDYLVTKFLAKYPDFRHENLDPEGKALQTFLDCETVCKETNRRFIELKEDPSLWAPEMRRVFLSARRKIAFVLGEPDLARISDEFGWGPGATSVASGAMTSAYSKFKMNLEVTSNALIMGHCCINSTPAWVNCQLQTDEFPSVPVSIVREAFHTVRGNEIVFVPKNAKTHRAIAIEPHVNSYLQRGFGREIRRLMRIRCGQDLNDQSRNQRLAQSGSLTGDLATIDLSGASDTISTELVRYLLPAKWFRLLDMTRSKQGFLRKEGTWLHYNKFSSMGNGYTFELESLIFWALCEAAQDVQTHFTSVYGDDLVVPTHEYDAVVRVLNFAGFRVNSSKSFHSGLFRESCGKDYFFGQDVRPIFLKENISNVESVFKLANSIRRYAHRRNSYCGCDARLYAAWRSCVEGLPKAFHSYRIPEGFGDCGLVSNFDEARPTLAGKGERKLLRLGWGGYLFNAITRSPIKRPMLDGHSGYTTVLSVIGSGGDSAGEQSRDRFRLDRTVKPDDVDRNFSSLTPLRGSHDLRKSTYAKATLIHAHGWHDFGPWQ